MRIFNRLTSAVLLYFLFTPAQALVHYDMGRINIDGVQLLQTVENEAVYEYLPPTLSLTTNEAGDFELLIMKYVGKEDGSAGGLFHALVGFELPEKRLKALQKKLEEKRPGAKLGGPVRLFAQADDKGSREGSFEVISATLTEESTQGAEFVPGKVISSGVAPFTPGSKAAIAARLSATQATLLWDSLTGSTADLSVGVHGYYEAKVEGYNAIVKAEMSKIYEHKSIVDNVQEGYTKRQLRDITDQLIDDNTIKVEVFDQSEGTGINVKSMERIVNLITDKLVDIMFDRKAGWAKDPAREAGVESGQLAGRQKTGFFSKVFGGSKNPRYISDDQFTMKKRSDVVNRSFTLNLSKTSVVRVPFDTAGNLGGFYQELDEEMRSRHFKVVSTDDSALSSQDVVVQLDGGFVKGFGDLFNSVSVNVRRQAKGNMPAFTETMVFDSASVSKGKVTDSFRLLRLGDESDSWNHYEYRVAWNLRGDGDVIKSPKNNTDWIKTNRPSLPLVPPLQRHSIYVEADPSEFKSMGIIAAELRLLSILNGKPRVVAEEMVRARDSDPSRSLVIYHDQNEAVVSQIIWHTRKGRAAEPLSKLDGSLVTVFAPDSVWLDGKVSRQ